MLTEHQREQRKLGIGGSDLAIILGISTYKTPYQLYLEKLGLHESFQEQTPNQYWGSKLEAVIRDEFAQRHNIVVETPDTLVHPLYPHLRANLDGFIPTWNSVLEIKCSNRYDEWGDILSDTIPLPYLTQVAHYCAVTNADSAHIAVLICGFSYREYKYIRDLTLEAMLLDAATKFWDNVQNNIPPQPINIDDLRLAYPGHVPDKKTYVTHDVDKSIHKLQNIQEQLKSLDKDAEKLKFEIMGHMEDSECLINADGHQLVTWRKSKSGSRSFVVKKVK